LLECVIIDRKRGSQKIREGIGGYYAMMENLSYYTWIWVR